MARLTLVKSINWKYILPTASRNTSRNNMAENPSPDDNQNFRGPSTLTTLYDYPSVIHTKTLSAFSDTLWMLVAGEGPDQDVRKRRRSRCRRSPRHETEQVKEGERKEEPKYPKKVDPQFQWLTTYSLLGPRNKANHELYKRIQRQDPQVTGISTIGAAGASCLLPSAATGGASAALARATHAAAPRRPPARHPPPACADALPFPTPTRRVEDPHATPGTTAAAAATVDIAMAGLKTSPPQP
uniref:Uncharacterized protein n=1 Tax=Oryza nivara TaxID=4536 RepID=A0A0E0H7F7_ORYNI